MDGVDLLLLLMEPVELHKLYHGQQLQVLVTMYTFIRDIKQVLMVLLESLEDHHLKILEPLLISLLGLSM